jgi:hypothetical protein
MEKTELYEMIESYLKGSLPENKRQEVERRMAADDAFREEVELHRALQEDYEDPARWRLREVLAEVMQATLPDGEAPAAATPGKPQRFRKWWFALPLVLLLCGGIWYFWKPAVPPAAPASPAIETPATPLPEKQQDTPPANEEKENPQPEPKALPEQPKKTAPIAEANPSDFEKNASMENLIGHFRSGEDMKVIIKSPQIGERIKWRIGRKTEMQLSGEVIGAPANANVELELLIFKNTDAGTPLLSERIQIKTNAEGNAAFERRINLDLRRGLYYFRMDEMSGDMLSAGKFFIGSL